MKEWRFLLLLPSVFVSPLFLWLKWLQITLSKFSMCGVELRSQNFKVIQHLKFLETCELNALYLYTMLLLLSNYQALLKDSSLSTT